MLAEKLGELIKKSPDADCIRIRPYDVADAWKRDRRTVLVAFLQGVAAGLVGPLLAAANRRIPVVVGEIAGGLVIGAT